MPKTKRQELVFGLIMVCLMCYFMTAYNMSLQSGLSWSVLWKALCALPLVAVVAFTIEGLVVGKLARKAVFKALDARKMPPIVITVAISVLTVAMMCPAMSLFATLAFEFDGFDHVILNWLQAWTLALPAALLWNLLYAGPLARWLLKIIFKHSPSN